MFISFSHDINYNSDSLVSRNNSPYETNNNAIHFLTFYFHSEIKTMGKEQLEAGSQNSDSEKSELAMY